MGLLDSHKASDEALKERDSLIALMKSQQIPFGMLAEAYYDLVTGENFGTSALYTLSGNSPLDDDVFWTSGDLYNFEKYGLISNQSLGFDSVLDKMLSLI